MLFGDCSLALCAAFFELFLSQRRKIFAKNACIPPKMSFQDLAPIMHSSIFGVYLCFVSAMLQSSTHSVGQVIVEKQSTSNSTRMSFDSKTCLLVPSVTAIVELASVTAFSLGQACNNTASMVTFSQP
jgi:hypothetical protein